VLLDVRGSARIANTLEVKRLEVEEIYSPFGRFLTDADLHGLVADSHGSETTGKEGGLAPSHHSEDVIPNSFRDPGSESDEETLKQVQGDTEQIQNDAEPAYRPFQNLSETTVSGKLTVKGKSYFLDDVVTNNTVVTGDLSQAGTLLIRDGEKIDNMAGDLQIQGDGKGDTVFGREMARISKKGTVSAKKIVLGDSSFSEEELEQIETWEATTAASRHPEGATATEGSLQGDSSSPEAPQNDTDKISENHILGLLKKVRNVFEVKVKDKLVAYLDNTGRFFARVLAGKRVETDTISPLAGGDLAIKLGKAGEENSQTLGVSSEPGSGESPAPGSTEAPPSRFKILNSENTEVASIDEKGTAILGKLNIREAIEEKSPALGVSSEPGSGESMASIGSGTIQAGRLNTIIQTNVVTADSKIFITPTSSTGGQVPYIFLKIAGEYFIVRMDQILTHNVYFDWWIVN